MGKSTAWDVCVSEIDTEKLASDLEAAGVGYLIFTMMQRTRFMCAPNAVFDGITGYQPGEACAKRDLVTDLYESLSKRGIDLMLYWTGDGPLDDPKAGSAYGYTTQNEPVGQGFVEKWAATGAEYSRRYGKKVKGWWVDGCYKQIGYDQKKLEILARGLRTGNPDAIIALNRGVEKRVEAYADCEDYTCGEMNAFEDLPDTRFVGGKQWHILSYLGESPDTPWNGWCRPGCRYDGAYMREYVKRVHSRGGVVTVDVILFRDGHLDPAQIGVLSEIGRD